MNIHPVANLFPDIDAEDFDELVTDIKKHGVLESIWITPKQEIIDGRHRYRACEQLGIKCPTRTYEGDDLVAFVASLNLHRRHLTKGQLALAAARAREYYDEQAKERLKQGQEAGRQKQKGSVEILPQTESARARDLAGKAFGVSGKYVDYATKVIENAVPELVAAVEKGSMSITTAAILSTEPEDIQIAEAIRPRRNRTYHSTTKSREDESVSESLPVEEIKLQGVGVLRANEAINALTRIPKNDALRSRGLQIVTDWIKNNR